MPGQRLLCTLEPKDTKEGYNDKARPQYYPGLAGLLLSMHLPLNPTPKPYMHVQLPGGAAAEPPSVPSAAAPSLPTFQAPAPAPIPQDTPLPSTGRSVACLLLHFDLILLQPGWPLGPRSKRS